MRGRPGSRSMAQGGMAAQCGRGVMTARGRGEHPPSGEHGEGGRIMAVHGVGVGLARSHIGHHGRLAVVVLGSGRLGRMLLLLVNGQLLLLLLLLSSCRRRCCSPAAAAALLSRRLGRLGRPGWRVGGGRLRRGRLVWQGGIGGGGDDLGVGGGLLIVGRGLGVRRLYGEGVG